MCCVHVVWLIGRCLLNEIIIINISSKNSSPPSLFFYSSTRHWRSAISLKLICFVYSSLVEPKKTVIIFKHDSQKFPPSFLEKKSLVIFIQPPLQIRVIGKMYRLSAVCNEQIKQNSLLNTTSVSIGFPKFN